MSMPKKCQNHLSKCGRRAAPSRQNEKEKRKGGGRRRGSNKQNIETAAFEISKGERESGRKLLSQCEMQLWEAEGLAGR